MVDVMGHLAMGLLWAIPAWFIWSRRASLAFISLAAVAALLPDIDLWITKVFPALVHHHGVTHTVVFVLGLGIAVGAVVAATLTGPIDRWLRNERFTTSSLFVFAAGGIVIGGLSHLFADMLSAPDIATPIEPFWPFFDKPWSVDVIWYNDPLWNVGLLTVAIFLHAAIAFLVDPVDHPYRMTET